MKLECPEGNDPDNRRMMHFNDWNSSQSQLQASTEKLVNLRRTCMALTYGDTEIIYNENGVMVLGRKYFESVALTVLSKGLTNEAVVISLPERYKMNLKPFLNNNIRLNENELEIAPGKPAYQVFFK